MPSLTKTAEDVWEPTEIGGAPRGSDMGEEQTWGMEIEGHIDALYDLIGAGTDEVTATATLLGSEKSGTLYVVSGLAANGIITLPGAAGAGDGYEIGLVRTDASAFTLTVTRAASDVIDGWATSFVMLSAGDAVTLKSDGSNWLVLDCRIAPVREIVTTTTAAKALYAGERRMDFRIVGAGGAGGSVDGTGSANASVAAGGGGAGAESSGWLNVRTLTTVDVTIGAAGAAGAAGNNPGGSGGDSALAWGSGANVVTSGGGSGGLGSVAATTAKTILGGSGGAPATTGSTALVSGLVQKRGSTGRVGQVGASSAGVATSGAGADSLYGGGGPALQGSGATGSAGSAGQGYGSGGSGAVTGINAATDYAGGAGAPGMVELVHHILKG